MKAVAFALVLAVALAGCGDKKKLSEADMETSAAEALADLQTDFGPGGAINGGTLSVPFDASDYGLGPLVLSMDLVIGVDADMLVTASFGNPFDGSRVDFTAYCSAEKVVVNVVGMESMGGEDVSVEGRNVAGDCTQASEDIQEMLGPFAALAKIFQVGSDLSLQEVRQTGKNTFEATYRDGSAASDLVVLVKNGRAELVSATSLADGTVLSVDITYGDREDIDAPAAQERVPLLVEWSGKALDNEGGYQWTGKDGIGPVEDYSIRVYDRTASVPCRGGPSPVATFDLGGPAQQNSNGFTITFSENGDGVLGKHDWALIYHPDRFDAPWDYRVEVWDDWADSSADPLCGIPAAGGAWLALALLGLVAVGRRYV